MNNDTWCDPLDFTVCVEVTDGTSKWCGEKNNNTVIQTGAFNEVDFTITVDYSSVNETSAHA
jgi:hypothetical protein